MFGYYINPDIYISFFFIVATYIQTYIHTVYVCMYINIICVWVLPCKTQAAAPCWQQAGLPTAAGRAWTVSQGQRSTLTLICSWCQTGRERSGRGSTYIDRHKLFKDRFKNRTIWGKQTEGKWKKEKTVFLLSSTKNLLTFYFFLNCLSCFLTQRHGSERLQLSLKLKLGLLYRNVWNSLLSYPFEKSSDTLKRIK